LLLVILLSGAEAAEIESGRPEIRVVLSKDKSLGLAGLVAGGEGPKPVLATGGAGWAW
jgi:hypothetical protein